MTQDTVGGYGNLAGGSFSSRAPRTKLNVVRFLFRDSTVFLILKIFLFFLVAGVLTLAFWVLWIGIGLILIAVVVGGTIWRYISLRQVEFMNAVLSPGLVINEKPLVVLVLADLSSDGRNGPVWAVKSIEVNSVAPLRRKVGAKVPCVTAFQGSGLNGSWDNMICSLLTDGTGDKARIKEALDCFEDEEWQMLSAVYAQDRFPALEKMQIL